MSRYLRYLLYLAVFLTFSFIGAWFFGGNDDEVALRNMVEEGSRTSGEDQRILYVYVTSPDCDACSSEDHVRLIRRSKRSLRDKFSEHPNLGFSSILVSTDSTPLRGLSTLESLGPFDEINIGNGWRNLGSSAFIWERLPSEPSIPQLSLFLVRYGGSEDRIRVQSRMTLSRMIGACEIKEWARDGFRVPLSNGSKGSATPLSGR